MVRTYTGIRLVIEVICGLILFSLVAVPATIAAFTVSVYMGVPFLCMIIAGFVKRLKYNS